MAMRRFGFIVTLAVALALSTSAVGFARGKASGGKGGGGSSSTLSLVLLNSTDGLPHWGQDTTFDVSTTATTQPFVHLGCDRGGENVYNFSAGFFDGYPWTTTFTLSSNLWDGGAADCVATLYYASRGKERTLATLGFHVEA